MRGIITEALCVQSLMDREPRHWRTALAIYLLSIFSLQAVIYLAVPKERYRSCRGWVANGPVRTEHRYISAYYLNRTLNGFTMGTEADFIESVHSQSSTSNNICIADINWYERVSLFDRLSLFSISDRKIDITSFSAREGSKGNYAPIGPSEHAQILSCIGYRTTNAGFVQLGTASFVLPNIDLLSMSLKLLIHSMLIWFSIRHAPSIYKEVRWFLLPTPRKNLGKCVNCQYSTVGLTTPICPECGLHHVMVWKPIG